MYKFPDLDMADFIAETEKMEAVAEELKKSNPQITTEEIVAEFEKREKKKHLNDGWYASKIKSAISEHKTSLIVDRQEDREVYEAVMADVMSMRTPRILTLSVESTWENFWKAMLISNRKSVWIIEGIENVKDQDVEKILFNMLRRETYTPDERYFPIDISNLDIVIYMRTPEGIDSIPFYWRDYAAATSIIEII